MSEAGGLADLVAEAHGTAWVLVAAAGMGGGAAAGAG